MYKKKLFFFGFITAAVLIIALAFASFTSYLTKQNLRQSSIAQSLHVEHEHLSNITYRLFKQFTDEFIFGANANQADVRKKRLIIQQTLSNIRDLERKQRQGLGMDSLLKGDGEATEQLETMISQIISEFELLLNSTQTNDKERRASLLRLLENDIDNQFREAIDTMLSHQQNVVTVLNARIDTLNTVLFWFSICVAVFSILFLVYGCYWLFQQLYKPLMLIQATADRIANGDYSNTTTEKLDDEFNSLMFTFNRLSERLSQHETNEKNSRKQLEFQVEQRTTELVKANAKLTSTDAKRRQFINDISHELRTPLTIIRGEAQVTLRIDSSTDDDYRQALQLIETQASKLGRLVDDLLLLARSEIDTLTLQLKQDNLYQLLKRDIDKWHRLEPFPVIELQVDEHMKTLELLIDAQRIEQVISILLDNAFKYAQTENPIIVKLFEQSNQAMVMVEDRGQGISSTEINHIFERFVRFKKGQADEGYGLGLPIAKTIIKAHGGSINVSSVQGEFCRFSISLPLDSSE